MKVIDRTKAVTQPQFLGEIILEIRNTICFSKNPKNTKKVFS